MTYVHSMKMLSRFMDCVNLIQKKYFKDFKENIEIMFFESKETFVKSFLFKEKQENNIVNLDGSFEFMRFILENDTRLVSNYKYKNIKVFLFQYENNLDNHIKIVSHCAITRI